MKVNDVDDLIENLADELILSTANFAHLYVQMCVSRSTVNFAHLYVQMCVSRSTVNFAHLYVQICVSRSTVNFSHLYVQMCVSRSRRFFRDIFLDGRTDNTYVRTFILPATITQFNSFWTVGKKMTEIVRDLQKTGKLVYII